MIISALERQEDLEFKSNLGYTVSLRKPLSVSVSPGFHFPHIYSFLFPQELVVLAAFSSLWPHSLQVSHLTYQCNADVPRLFSAPFPQQVPF